MGIPFVLTTSYSPFLFAVRCPQFAIPDAYTVYTPYYLYRTQNITSPVGTSLEVGSGFSCHLPKTLIDVRPLRLYVSWLWVAFSYSCLPVLVLVHPPMLTLTPPRKSTLLYAFGAAKVSTPVTFAHLLFKMPLSSSLKLSLQRAIRSPLQGKLVHALDGVMDVKFYGEREALTNAKISICEIPLQGIGKTGFYICPNNFPFLFSYFFLYMLIAY